MIVPYFEIWFIGTNYKPHVYYGAKRSPRNFNQNQNQNRRFGSVKKIEQKLRIDWVWSASILGSWTRTMSIQMDRYIYVIFYFLQYIEWLKNIKFKNSNLSNNLSKILDSNPKKWRLAHFFASHLTLDYCIS